MSRGLAAKRPPTNKIAQGEGIFPVEKVKKRTAYMSCMIRIPMDTRPCIDAISPLSSKILTAKTVLEKLNAKAIINESLKSSSLNGDKPVKLKTKMPTPKTKTVTII